jgi:hypothetical protein
MAKKKTERAEIHRQAILHANPALELDDIDRLSRIELRLRSITDILALSRPDIYTFLRPVWDDLEQFQASLVERWNLVTEVKVQKKGAAA